MVIMALTLLLSAAYADDVSFGKISAAVGAKLKPDWTYDINSPSGPHSWHYNYSNCKGTRQSPIDIQTEDLPERFRECQAPVGLMLKNYDMGQFGTVENTGHHVRFEPKLSFLRLFSSILDTDYALEEVRFHWGNHSQTGGSEHLLNGKRLPMEIQFLHSPEKRRSEFQSKVILSVLTEMSMEDNEALSDIVSALPYIYQPNEKKSLKSPISLRKILPPTTSFYYYKGSQTVPPCEENVHWLIMQETIGVSEGQLLAFRSLFQDSHGLINNYRPIQPLGDRKIHRSCLSELEPSTTLAIPTASGTSKKPNGREDIDKNHKQSDDPKSTLPRGAPKSFGNGQDTSVTQRSRLTSKTFAYTPVSTSNAMSYGTLLINAGVIVTMLHF